jgi:hypothetical protein
MKIPLAIALLTTALAQTVPVTIVNQCGFTVSPQFLGTGRSPIHLRASYPDDLAMFVLL